MKKTTISGSGSILPALCIGNTYFETFEFWEKDGTPIRKPTKEIVEKLEAISGISERRYIGEDEESADILFAASQNALLDAGLDPNALGGIIVAHNAGNFGKNTKGDFTTVPNLGARLKNRLGVENYECPAFDLLFGCPGWVQGLMQADLMIRAGEAQHILVAGVEVASRLLDPHEMDSMLMADGCGAVVLSAADEENEDSGFLASAVFSHALDDLNHIGVGHCLNPDIAGHSFFKMNGKEVYRYATTWLPKVVQKALDKANLTPQDIDLFFFHQANGKMLSAIAHNLMQLYGQQNLPYAHKIPSIIAYTGNTSVATVPTLFDRVKKGLVEGFALKKGQKWVFASVGAGMHCNAIVYQN